MADHRLSPYRRLKSFERSTPSLSRYSLINLLGHPTESPLGHAATLFRSWCRQAFPPQSPFGRIDRFSCDRAPVPVRAPFPGTPLFDSIIIAWEGRRISPPPRVGGRPFFLSRLRGCYCRLSHPSQLPRKRDPSSFRVSFSSSPSQEWIRAEHLLKLFFVLLS